MNHRGRQKNLRGQLASGRLDAVLISHLPNIRYLCGFTGSAGLLLVEESGSVFFTDVRYATQSREEVEGAGVVIARKALVSALAERVAGVRKKSNQWRIGLEADHLSVAEKKRLRDLMPRGVQLRSAPPLVERARMVKDATELERIRAAVLLGTRLFERALEVIRPGVRENEVAAEMEYAARRAGAEEMSFPTIIASGARSALGYCSDQSRTVWVGEPTEEARRGYDAVKQAQLSAIASVQPGATVAQVDTAARKVLRRAGLGRYFTHSTGHGVGLEIHEAPRVAQGQNEVLQPGMVITIEPGVYFPGKWGVRIEDMVAVTAHGCEVLTPTSKDFLAI